MITFKKVFFTVFNVIICFYAYAQLSTGGTPASFALKEDNISIPAVITPAIDAEQIKKEDLSTNVKASGYRFGIDFYYSLSMTDQGVWTTLPDGDQICRLRLVCPGAVSVCFTFDQYHLPEGAKLFAYTPDKQQVLGAFTSLNNQEDGYFAVSLLTGDEVILEYLQPTTCSEQPLLRLWRITHGYRGPAMLTKGFGDAGACHINVKCPEGKGWEDPINATCAILDGGTELCTGTLINNTRQDGTPYLLTANHCYTYSLSPSTWVFWFNWESPTCANVSKSPSKNTLSGAKELAASSYTDFCLLRLNTAPPVSYNPVYCGWSRLDTPPDSAVCIHHPHLDVKKITPSDNIVISSFFETPEYPNAWQAFWGTACTESGSSGCALFDKQRRIIGQLWGGASHCDAPAEEMYDYFGRLDLSWNGYNENTRLRDWLDPDSTNLMTLDAYYPVAGIHSSQATRPQLTISPNPCQKTTYIELGNATIDEIRLYDVTGKLMIKQQGAGNSRSSLNVGHLPKGLYIVTVETDSGQAIGKLVVD